MLLRYAWKWKLCSFQICKYNFWQINKIFSTKSQSILQQEMNNFILEIDEASLEDQNSRIESMEYLQHICENQLSKYSLQPTLFGSCTTALCLPNSDLDISLIRQNTSLQQPLTLNIEFRKLEYKILKDLDTIFQNQCKTRKRYMTGIYAKNSTFIQTARVPIVKVKLSNSVELDICFQRPQGIIAAKYLNMQMQTYPQTRILTLLLKNMFKERDLHGAFKGGISSYAVTLLVIRFLQFISAVEQHNKNQIMEWNDATTFVQLLRFYGLFFDYKTYGVDVTKGGSFFEKDNNYDFSKWTVLDPLDENNNVAASLQRSASVQQALAEAAHKLVAASRIDKPELLSCITSSPFVKPYSSKQNNISFLSHSKALHKGIIY